MAALYSCAIWGSTLGCQPWTPRQAPSPPHRTPNPEARLGCSVAHVSIGASGGRISVARWVRRFRSEEHTSELQSLMRISYAVFCLKNKNTHKTDTQKYTRTY